MRFDDDGGRDGRIRNNEVCKEEKGGRLVVLLIDVEGREVVGGVKL